MNGKVPEPVLARELFGFRWRGYGVLVMRPGQREFRREGVDFWEPPACVVPWP
jgi:hypothetical protein